MEYRGTDEGHVHIPDDDDDSDDMGGTACSDNAQPQLENAIKLGSNSRRMRTRAETRMHQARGLRKDCKF